MPPILDVAIGTVFVFLLFSLVVTALNEYILSLLDERAKFLRMGLAEIFGKAMVAVKRGDAEKPAAFGAFKGYPELCEQGEKLLAHGLINGFSRPGSSYPSPSYIPAGAFVTALLDIVADGGSPAAGGPATAGFHTAESIKAGIDKLPPGKLREGLLSLYRSVDGDVQRFKEAVEGWFNGVMDRVSGWYKRFAQNWMIGLAFILAAVINVDTVDVVRVLSNNPNLAKAVADGAATYVSENDKPLAKEELAAKSTKLRTDLGTAKADLNALAADSPDREAANQKVVKLQAEVDELGNYETAVAKLAETGIPIGWTPSVCEKLGWKGFRGTSSLSSLRWDVFLSMLAGWALTAIAASIGAPFWFDLLGRFVNIRAAGRAPGEKEAASTPTKPPLVTLDTTQGVSPPTPTR